MRNKLIALAIVAGFVLFVGYKVGSAVESLSDSLSERVAIAENVNK